jgi:leader peptidase (prepilin peptidase)/N-methyltransferase
VIAPILIAAAGLVAGSLANLPVERLPAMILEGEGGARTPGRPWRAGRRVFMGLATAGLFALAFYRYEGDWLRVSASAVFAAAFLALAVIDLENQLLPDLIVLPGLIAALAISPFLDHLSPWDGAAGAAFGFLVFLPIWGWAALTGREGRIMGFGDLKFTAMMGAVLGLQFLGVALYAGVLLGGAVAAGLLAGRALFPDTLGRLRVMPYGTFLAAGGLIALFYGRPVVQRVIDFLG